MESSCDVGFTHDEADVTMIAYLLQVADENKVIYILCDDTDVLVLLIYWV